jgi:hypothetical protein
MYLWEKWSGKLEHVDADSAQELIAQLSVRLQSKHLRELRSRILLGQTLPPPPPVFCTLPKRRWLSRPTPAGFTQVCLARPPRISATT